MHNYTSESIAIDSSNQKYSHCCIEKYGSTKKWMKDDFNLQSIEPHQISVFNKVKVHLDNIPTEQNIPNTTEREQYTLLIEGSFYKMLKHTISSDQLKNGDLIHYIITADPQLILCNESRHDNVLKALTDREKEVLALFAQGHSMTRIAKVLFLSPHTIDSHRMNLCKKLNVKRTTELAVWAHKLGLLN